MTVTAAPRSLEISTRLFGDLTIELSDLIHFPEALPGFPECRSFVLLPTGTDTLAWLQSADQPGIALLLVTPEAAAPGAATFPEPLRRKDVYTALVVTLPGQFGPATANLQAPIVIDRATGIGRQVILPDSRFGVTHPFDLQALTAAAA